MKTVTKCYCDKCNHELDFKDCFSESKISDKITERVLKDLPLTYRPNDIYEIIEGNEYDVVTYDYEKVYLRYKCPNCNTSIY